MKHSEKLGEIAKALSLMQGEIKDAEKDTDGYGYKYADLSQVLRIIRPLMAKNGLSVTQHVSNADDKIVIETMLMHSSGEWMSSELSLPPVPSKSMNAAQAVGSVITYGRRYALTAIFGITQADDDTSSERVVHDASKRFTTNDSRRNNAPEPRRNSTPVEKPVASAVNSIDVSSFHKTFINIKEEKNELAGIEFWKERKTEEKSALWNIMTEKEKTWMKDVLNKDKAPKEARV